MSQLPALSPSHVPHRAHPVLEDRIARLHNGLGSVGYLSAAQAPDSELRQQLETRSQQISAWMAPLRSMTECDRLTGELVSTGEKMTRTLVAAVLAVLPAQASKGDASDADKIQGLYVRALIDLPRFALQHACAMALRSGIGGKIYAPTPAQIREVAEEHCRSLLEEQRKINAVLQAKIGAPISDPNRKAALLKAANDMVGGMRRSAEGTNRGRMTPEEIAEAKAVSDAWAAGKPDPRPMPKFSARHRAALGLPDVNMVPDLADSSEDAA